MTYRCLVSPSFKQQYFPEGVDVNSLMAAPSVEFNHKYDLQRQYLSRYFDAVYPAARHRIPSAESFNDFIARGYAWGMAPDVQSHAWLKSGKVIELVEGNTIDVPLYWHIWNLRTTLSRELTAALQVQAEKVLTPIN